MSLFSPHIDSETTPSGARLRPTWATIGCRREPGGFQLGRPCHSWWGCSRRWQSGGSCSTCKNKRRGRERYGGGKVGATTWGWHQGQSPSAAPAEGFGSGSTRANTNPPRRHPDTSTASSRQIRDKDQLSGEKPVAWERLCEAAAFCWVRIKRQCAAPVLQMIGSGGCGRLASRHARMCVCVYSLVFVRCFPQLVRRHPGWEIVVLHDVLEVELRHHLELQEEGHGVIHWSLHALVNP